MMSQVKPTRRYDSTRRREQAVQVREAILAVARERFLAEGFAATTVAAVAREAGVSIETVYKAFRNKVGLLRAVAERAMAGPDAVPTMRRSDEMAARETDPYVIVREWARFATEVTPRVAPVMLLMRTAAGHSPDIADLLAQLDADRLARMAHQARFLRDRHYLRHGVTDTEARDVMWAYTDPALYELLVIRAQWPLPRFRDFLANALTAALLPGR
jgi:AcrR family transcriptional regulator